jgi:plasmid stability protein
MAQILVRDLDPEDVERLKALAKANGRSLESEVRQILAEAARQMTWAEVRANLLAFHERFAGKTFSDSTELIREDRDSR